MRSTVVRRAAPSRLHGSVLVGTGSLMLSP